ncbi:MAG: hypothetical protein AAB362_00510 [Patescibacteria group bacterium]
MNFERKSEAVDPADSASEATGLNGSSVNRELAGESCADAQLHLINETAIKISEYINTHKDAIQSRLKSRIDELIRDAREVIHDVDIAKSGEDSLDGLISMASVRAGFDELRNEFFSEEKEEEQGAQDMEYMRGIAPVHRTVLAVLMQRMEGELLALPLPRMDVAPEDGIARLHQMLQEQKESPYARTATVLGEKFRDTVECAVRNQLERFAGRIPFESREKVIAAASKFSGKVAFGLTVFGTGLLAFGVGQNESFAKVDMEINQENKILEIKNTETNEVVSVVSYDAFGKYTPSEQKNQIYERFISYDYSGKGVNYTVENTEQFERIIVEDANAITKEIFNTSPKELSASDFITLVNVMVQRRIEYDNEAVVKNSSGLFFAADNAEDKKISSMSLDAMYLEYGKGVCRHYAALVELIGERLIRGGIVPQMAGLSIDEVASADQNHAWNIYYLNPESDSKRIIVGFTDAQANDGGRYALEARDGGHPSISDGVIQRFLFSESELKEIYEKLIDLKLGTWEDRVASRRLAQMYFDDGAVRYFTETRDSLDNEANDKKIEMHAFGGGEAENLLKIARKYAVMGGIDGVDLMSLRMRFVFNNSSDLLINGYERGGEFDEAVKIAEYASILLGDNNEAGKRFLERANDLRIKVSKTH